MQLTYKHTLRACYMGYITQAIINNLAPILFIIFQTDYQISYEKIGRLILINFGTQILADVFAVKCVDKIGYRSSAVLAHGMCVVGLIGLSVLPNVLPSPYVGLVLAVIVYAIGGGLLEVLVSPIVDSLPGDEKASAMSILHSFYCWGQMGVVLVTTLLLKLLGSNIWAILPLLWALIPLTNLFRFLKVPLAPMVEEKDAVPLRSLLNSRFFLVALLLMLCAGASELTMSQWSSLFAEKGLQVPKVVGDLAGPCLFALLMGTGRMLYGKFGSKIKLQNALLLSGGLCVVCYAITVFSPWPLLSLLGCALSGFSVSLMWPGTFSLSTQRFPNRGTAMFGMLAVFGDIGGAIGPWLAGLVSDLAQKSQSVLQMGNDLGLDGEQIGLKCGLLGGMVFPLVLFLGILLLKKGGRKASAMNNG